MALIPSPGTQVVECTETGSSWGIFRCSNSFPRSAVEVKQAFFALTIVLGLLGCRAAEPILAQPTSQPEQIRLLIGQLSDATERKRTKAEEELFQIGEPVVQFLETAIKKAHEAEAQERETRLRRVLAIIRSARYFPMEVGDRWLYKSGRSEVSFEVRGTALVRGWKCFEVVRSIGSEQVVFYLSVSRKGVKIHRVGDDYFSPPFLEFKFPLLEEGSKWEWTGSIGEQFLTIRSESEQSKSIRVPMGTFKAIYVKEEMIRGISPYWVAGWTSFWLVEGIGVVRLSGKKMDLHNPTSKDYLWELKEFKRGSD